MRVEQVPFGSEQPMAAPQPQMARLAPLMASQPQGVSSGLVEGLRQPADAFAQRAADDRKYARLMEALRGQGGFMPMPDLGGVDASSPSFRLPREL